MGYSDGTYLCDGYDSASGWLSSVAITAAGTSSTVGCTASGQTTLASGLSYSGDAGAAEQVTGASVNTGNPGGTTYTYAPSYDGDLRLLGSSMTLTSNGATLFGSTRGYDGAGNVTRVATTLGTGSTTSTDNQSFCYDEQNRLIWATSQSATGPNGCASNTAGSLSSAAYTQPFSYDPLDRLSSNDVGSYTYGPGLQAGANPSPLHGAIAIPGRNYTATYDASGNMVCRAPNSTLTCASGQTATGQQLGYDAAGHLTSWQDGTESPPNVAVTYAYDGEGNRVAQHVLSFGSAWTTAYLLGDTAETTEGSGTFTDYLAVPGVGTAVETNSPSSPALSYLVTDGLNSVSVALDALGNVSGQALYLPYGIGRYFSGRFPTTHGFTGQDEDGNATGLYYDHARYYDPAIGQFAQADSFDGGGLNRFAYVKGNPETDTDPTGHMQDPNDGGGQNLWKLPIPRPINPGPGILGITGLGSVQQDEDECFPRGCFSDEKGRRNNPRERAGGDWLAWYFGVHVTRKIADADKPGAGPRGPQSADYDVYYQRTVVAPDMLPMTMEGSHVAVDFYAPTTTNWGKDPGADHPGGIVGQIIQKGAQASIVVVDLSLIDPSGSISQSDLTQYAERAVYAPYSGEKSSQVARVIFIRDGSDGKPQLVQDFNPRNYGPAPASHSGWMSGGYAI